MLIKPYQFSYFGLSDIGLSRQNNEDVWSHKKESSFFALADGMGGHKAGEIAAKEAITFICASIEEMLASSKVRLKTEDLQSYLKIFIENTNSWVYHLSKQNKQLHGMGTTLCTLLFYEKELILGHVGDSRIYRFRENLLTQLTKDHSLKNELISQGRFIDTPKTPFLHKNVLTRAIGSHRDVTPELSVVPVKPSDIYLMCSDGLSDYVTDERISFLIKKSTTPENASEALVNEAKKCGGKDNITVVMVKVDEYSKETNIFR
ncbi:MAG: Stp1/IreP family PP2C-type Ser/Thr phosphatase [Simkaniaceae bacterium]|nr:Stp1/IreP family PP2C-type Ser/Thr phosphatase [Simkaniaceae bacterium]